MQDKLDKAKAAIAELFEMQDEVIQVMILTYMRQNGHTTEDNPCSEETLVKIGQYVLREISLLGLWTSVINGKLKMSFKEDDDEPLFSLTDSGAKHVEEMDAVEIKHESQRLTLEEAVERYRVWMEFCNWSPRPSFIYWWFVTERAPHESSGEDFDVGLEDFRRHKRAIYGQKLDVV